MLIGNSEEILDISACVCGHAARGKAQHSHVYLSEGLVHNSYQSANVDLQTPQNFLSTAVAWVCSTLCTAMAEWYVPKGARAGVALPMMHAASTYVHPTTTMQNAKQAARGR